MADPFFLNKPAWVSSNQPQSQSAQPQQLDQEPQQQAAQQPPQLSSVKQPVKVQTVVKQWNRVSFWWLLIGCGVFLILFLAAITAGLYYIATNPQSAQGLGLSPSTTKNLLLIFTIFLFGGLFFGGFGLTAVNGYRLFTKSEGSKAAYFGGLVVGIVGIILSLVAGSRAIARVRALDVSGVGLDTGLPLVGMYQLANAQEVIMTDPQLIKIAPATVIFKLNNPVINQIVRDIQPSTFTLDCGNGMTIPLDSSRSSWSCFYTQKGNFAPLMSIDYVDKQTGAKKKQQYPLGPLVFASAFTITPVATGLLLNTDKTEYIIGNAPAKVSLNAQQIFTDLQLPAIKITWDLENDNVVDRQDTALVNTTFNKPGLSTIVYTLPTLSSYKYVLPLRVSQWDVPVCIVTGKSTSTDWRTYQFSTNFEDTSVAIKEYIYDVINVDTEKVVHEEKRTNQNFSWEFVDAWRYLFRTTFVTDQNKKGSCETDTLQILSSDFDVAYELLYKAPSSSDYVQFQSTGWSYFAKWVYTIDQIPTTLQLHIQKVVPADRLSTLKVFYNWEQVSSIDQSNFPLVIDKWFEGQRSITVQWEGPNGQILKKEIVLQVRQKPISGVIKVVPWYVGTDPFDVTLDASPTSLADPNDEIVYFTWDFWDWEISRNVSRWSVSHTYRFDKVRQAGDYLPKVTVKTRKWLTSTFSTDQPISVKRPERKVTINLESHPAQVATVGDVVKMSLETSWPIRQIARDFGDGNTQECEDRSCVEMSKVYDTPGVYVVKVTIKYDDYPTIDQSVTLQVR